VPESPALDALIEGWTDEVRAAEPSLAPYLAEVADHLRSSVEAHLESGGSLDAAFAAAVDEFGDPRDLSREFAKSRRWPGRVLVWLADERHETRGDLTISGAWIGFSLAWSIALFVSPLVGVPLTAEWMVVGWLATTFAPLSILDAFVKHCRRSRREA